MEYFIKTAKKSLTRAVAGINIAGCDFGVQTDVRALFCSIHVCDVFRYEKLIHVSLIGHVYHKLDLLPRSCAWQPRRVGQAASCLVRWSIRFADNLSRIGQMQHFVNDDKLNIFRLPVAWQYLVNGTLGGTLNPTYSGDYDLLVQGCLATGAHCIIDVRLSYPFL